ncbi:MAG: diguanylate cyclase, partial [Alphaproteobacteria bacterium]|nr:diguanylate cyclase [Alphaproteobacteria bacterium]
MASTIAALAFGFPALLWSWRSKKLEQHERELDMLAQSFKAALDHLPVGITMFDRDGALAVANEKYARMFSIPLKEVTIGASYTALRQLRMKSATPVRSEMPRGMDGADPLRNTREIWETNDGRTVVTARYPTPDGGWIAVHEDITQRLTHEEELEQAKRFLGMVIDNLPGSIIVKDAKTLEYALINKEVEKIIGLPRHDIIGKHAAQLFPFEHAQTITQRDRDALDADDSCPMALENAVITPGHGERMIRTKRIALRDSDGGSSHLLMVTEDVTEKRRAEEKITFLAQRDTLTGLYNRTYFKEHVENALVHMRDFDCAAVLYLDLDGFKEINDTFGHSAGDEILRGTADRLKAIFDKHDVVARLGGDEFAVLCRSTPGTGMMETIAQRILESLRQPYHFDDRKVRVEASVGIAFANGENNDYDMVTRQADVALYEAKSAGKGTFKLFDAEMMARRLKKNDRKRSASGDRTR